MFSPRAPETLTSIRSVPSWLRNARKESIRIGVPSLMEAISGSMHHEGVTVEQAVREAPVKVKECPRALIEEMASVGLLMDAGATLEEAMKSVALRVDIPEFDLLVSSLQSKDGNGRMKTRHEIMQSLVTVASRLRERNETLGLMHVTERNAVTIGAVVGSVPFAALLLLNVIFPEDIAMMSSSVMAQTALILAFAFVMTGVAWICALGRTTPGQSKEEVMEISQSLPRRIAGPILACIMPALALLGVAPILAHLG